MPSRTFSSTVFQGNSAFSWNTKAMSCGIGPRTGLPATSTAPPVGVIRPPMTLSSVLLPQPLGPIRQSSSPRGDVERRVGERAHELRLARLAELVRDVFDADRGVARGHFGRYASVSSVAMSGFAGSSFMSTKEFASTSSAFGLKRPSRLKIGMVSS